MTEHLSEQAANAIVQSAISAGQLIKAMRKDGAAHSTKPDGSPVTEADVAAERIILQALGNVLPHMPVVAEESFSACLPDLRRAREFMLVDPLDGTKEYVRGKKEYTVNVGLVSDGTPVFGVVVVPELDCAYLAQGGKAYRLSFDGDGQIVAQHGLCVRAPGAALTAIVSGSHLDSLTEAYMGAAGVTERISAGSSLKFCRVAAGEADVYPRLARTMQWDTAAGDAVLRAAGGMTHSIGGQCLAYGPAASAPDDENPFANSRFIAFGNWPEADRQREAGRCIRLMDAG